MDIIRSSEKIAIAGNSLAIDMGITSTNTVHVELTSIAGGTARIEYTLSTSNDVLDNSAIWLPWSNGDLTTSGGAIFNAPIRYIRVITSTTGVTAILQILS